MSKWKAGVSRRRFLSHFRPSESSKPSPGIKPFIYMYIQPLILLILSSFTKPEFNLEWPHLTTARGSGRIPRYCGGAWVRRTWGAPWLSLGDRRRSLGRRTSSTRGRGGPGFSLASLKQFRVNLPYSQTTKEGKTRFMQLFELSIEVTNLVCVLRM